VKARGWLPARRELVLAALTSLLLFAAYAPAALVVPSFVALVPLLWALDEGAPGLGGTEATSVPGSIGPPLSERPAAPAFRLGYWFGVLGWGLILHWMPMALWHFTPLSAAGYLAAVFIVLAPQWGAAAWATALVRRRTGLPLWLVFPVVWTAVEWIGGHYHDVRFPWLGLGTSLVRVPTLVQWADLVGARGVTLWLAWTNVMVYLALRSRAWRPAAAFGATAALALGYGLWRERTLVMRPVTTVAVLQPNVSTDEKRTSRDDERLVRQLLDLTRQARRDSAVRLVVWPEAAVPNYFVTHPQWEVLIGDLSHQLRTPIMAGGLDAEFRPDGSYQNWNAAFLFDTTGSARAQPSYRKRYLVPIVERVPFVNPDWFGRLRYFGGFERGERLPVYRIAEGSFGVLICYESAFEDLARRYRREGADFLVNVTNDAWFGRTAAPYQHASHLVMRAIETRMGVARAANTGISQFVDPLGRAFLNTPLFVERVEASQVLTTDVRTVYLRLGDWVAALALAGLAALLLTSLARRPGRA
jgi:apolipoprotein N-acyltransferase